MVHYDLSHLTQPEDQRVIGPIQDDEALFLYSIIRGMRLGRVLEIGGLEGYSAHNFLRAVSWSAQGVVYTVDLNPVPVQGPNHRTITKNARDLTLDDVDRVPVDLVFFDCHDLVQMEIYYAFVREGIITDRTVLALHDTNLHYAPFQIWGPYLPSEGGFAHQPVERTMVNMFKDLGYDVFSVHTTREKHDASFPFRHGVTVCQKFRRLEEPS
jgi:hypothetical protein